MILRSHKKTTWGLLGDHLGTTKGTTWGPLGASSGACMGIIWACLGHYLGHHQSKIFAVLHASLMPFLFNLLFAVVRYHYQRPWNTVTVAFDLELGTCQSGISLGCAFFLALRKLFKAFCAGQ